MGKTPTVISVDAMGGDHGPSAVVEGLAKSLAKNDNLRLLVHGRESEIRPHLIKRKIEDRCELRPADDVVSMDEKPSHVMRNGKKTSMWSAVESVRNGEAEVCVSCGNTGALMAVSMIRLRKIEGVNRPAIACLWPSDNPSGFNVMLDAGGDIRADQDDLLQYALMGMSYARNGLGISRPRIGLLNVGTEEHKGRAELKVAHDMIADAASANAYEFVGFVEGGDIPSDKLDVVVTDGFTGNVALKTAEGTAKLVLTALKGAFARNIFSRIAAVLAYPSLKRMSNRIDPRQVNGGVFLGLNGTVVKSHGSADATGVSSAIKLAVKLAESDFGEKLAARVSAVTPSDADEKAAAE